MMKVVFILFLLIFVFIGNIFLYFKNDEYKFFVKKIKYSDEVVYVKDGLNVSEWTWAIANCENLLRQKDLNNDWVMDFTSDSIEPWIMDMEEKRNLAKEKKEEEKKATMSVVGIYILDKLSNFGLRKIDEHPSLFDLTTEYPDNYLEYDSEDLVLYYFPTKDYNWVLEVFKALAHELPYTINEVNNFYWESFYINIEEDFKDNYVRFIFNYENNVFWLKIKNDRYNELKDIIKKL